MAENNTKTELPQMPRIGRGGAGQMNSRVNVQKPKHMKQTIGRLLQYIGRSKFILFGLIAMMLLTTGVEIAGPLFQQKAIDTISFSDGHLVVDLAQMRVYLVIMLCIFVLSAGMTYIQGILSAKLSKQTVYVMRKDLFETISRLPISYTDTHRHGDIMSRMTNDVENISNSISQSVTSLCSAVLTLIGALCMMIYYNPFMTLIALVTIPVTIAVSTNLAKFMRKYFVEQQKLLGQLNGTVEEMVTEYRTVVAYGKEEEALETFAKTADGLRTASIRARVWGSIMGPIMNFLGNLQYVLLASVGGYLILRGGTTLTIGSIQAMLQYSKKFSHPINMIANQYSAILTALAGAERIFEIMDSEPEVDEGTLAIKPEDIRGEISFRNVQFGYVPGEPVLKQFDLEIGAGKKIALVGATGSGKTTVVNLLTRFYELNGGEIRIDGVNITDLPKDTLRQSIGIVLQDAVLFRDTIAGNMRYGNPDATQDQLEEAAHTAMADGFIRRLPQQYETMLTESGSNLSQGQRQLLTIARAVLADPKILILDEATSSVDTRTEMQIQQAMNNLMKGRTSLVIAHRLSTIRDADCIVVLGNGTVVEAGSHEELLAKQGEYYKLYSKQFAGAAT